MIICEFVNRDGFSKVKVLDSPLPAYYSFSQLSPLTTENWFGPGPLGTAEVRLDQLLFHLKRQIGNHARYEEVR